MNPGIIGKMSGFIFLKGGMKLNYRIKPSLINNEGGDFSYVK